MSEVTIVTTGSLFTDRSQYFGLYGSFTWNSDSGNFLELGARGGALPVEPVEKEPLTVFIQNPNDNNLTRLGDLPAGISNRSAPDGTQVYSLTAAGVPPAIPLDLDVAGISNFNMQIFGGVALGIGPDGETKVAGGIRVDGKFASREGAPVFQQRLITDGSSVEINPQNILSGINDIPEGGDPIIDGKTGNLLVSDSYKGPYRNQAPWPETQAADELPFAIQLAKGAIPVKELSTDTTHPNHIVLKPETDRSLPLAGTVKSVHETPSGSLRYVLRSETEVRDIPGFGPFAFGKLSENAQKWQQFIEDNIIPPNQISAELKQQIEQLPELRNLIKYQTDFAKRYPVINDLIVAIDQRTALIAKQINPEGAVSESLKNQIQRDPELRAFIQTTELKESPGLRTLIKTAELAQNTLQTNTGDHTAANDPITEWKNNFLTHLEQNIVDGQLSASFSEFVISNKDWIIANTPELIPQLEKLLPGNKLLAD